jgi:arylformamidase
MATDWPSVSSDLPRDLIKSGVAISGIFDLEPMLYIPLNDDLKLDPESARRNSPIHSHPNTGAILSLVVGGDESEEFHRQSSLFAEKWKKHGAKTEYIELPGLNHFTVVNRMNDPDDPLTAIMLGHTGLGLA